MKKIKLTVLALAMIGVTAMVFAASLEKTTAQTPAISDKELVQRYGFVDEDGDGINDLARDADNDGIPNCMDPDWVRPEEGNGYKHKHGYKHRSGNGVHNGGENNFNYCYNYLWNHNWGGSQGTGVCDGSGPHGNTGRRGKAGNRH